jgi:quinol-cytochrome oxidoreductase complex cytochrome b subunit
MSSKRPNFFYHLHPPTLPARESSFTYTFGLGGISVFLSLVLLATGILLTFVYVPTPDEAFKSIEILTYQVAFGWLIRNMHYWAAQALVIVAVLHMLRIVFTGAYKAPRKTNYVIGILLLALIVLFNFTGYVLRWDEGTSWALTVGTSLLKEIPLIGNAVYQIIVGGSDVGATTTIRFYAWHVIGLTLIILILIAWHIFKVRRDGGISHRAREPRIDRARLVTIETKAMLIVGALLIFISIVLPAPIGPVADLPIRSGGVQAPWFFLWIQFLLRSLPAVWAGVLIPIGCLAILIVIPYLIDRKLDGVGEWFNRSGRIAQVISILMIAGIVLLSIIELSA